MKLIIKLLTYIESGGKISVIKSKYNLSKETSIALALVATKDEVEKSRLKNYEMMIIIMVILVNNI